MAGKNIYDDFIMDHIKNARNFRVLDDATHNASGSNPLCGDDITVYLKIDGDRIVNVSFQCTCCGISMASASIMTESVKGKPAADVKAQLHRIVESLNDRNDPAATESEPAQRALLDSVEELPARKRCATLPWLTLEAALENRQDTVIAR